MIYMRNIIKKIVSVILFVLLFVPTIIFAKSDKIDLYLFYGDGCPHCAQLENFLLTYNEMNNDIIVHKYEVWFDEDSQKKLKDVQKLLDTPSNGVPYLVIGNNVVIGYNEEYTSEYIVHAINYYKNVDYVDKVGHEHELSTGGKVSRTIDYYNKKLGFDLSYVTGAKTGHIKASGYCLASTATLNDVNYLLITLNAYGDSTAHLKDANTIYTYYAD